MFLAVLSFFFFFLPFRPAETGFFWGEGVLESPRHDSILSLLYSGSLVSFLSLLFLSGNITAMRFFGNCAGTAERERMYDYGKNAPISLFL